MGKHADSHQKVAFLIHSEYIKCARSRHCQINWSIPQYYKRYQKTYEGQINTLNEREVEVECRLAFDKQEKENEEKWTRQGKKFPTS